MEDIEDLNKRIRNLEVSVAHLEASVKALVEENNEFKQYLMQLGKNQKIIADRIALWPFVTVNKKETW